MGVVTLSKCLYPGRPRDITPRVSAKLPRGRCAHHLRRALRPSFELTRLLVCHRRLTYSAEVLVESGTSRTPNIFSDVALFVYMGVAPTTYQQPLSASC